jgi:ferric-dicitrate binding protein FerR (iron transport regulator)
MERISQLLYKHLQGILTEAEHAELMAWAATDPANWELLNRVIDEESLDANMRDWYAMPRRSVVDDPRLDAAIAQHEAASKRTPLHQLIKRILPYAAAVLIMVFAGIWWTLDQDQSQVRELAAEDISTGGNKASLTFADGRKIDLSTEQSGIIVGDGRITYDDGSSLAVLSDKVGTPQAIAQLELSTPRGGTYQMTLPDGSKVWLNAASTIRYPSSFVGDERVVEISGEAYFDIREDNKRPFKVMSRGQEVEVLGTEFNISAYADEKETRTTLVKGKIRLSLVASAEEASPISDKSTILMPGEQGAMRNGHIIKSNVEVSEYTAWKEGFFNFNRLPTPAAITQLARWYDLDVVYEGKMPEANLFAYIDRNKPLSAVLKALEKSKLKFKVVQAGERKQLIVLGEQ